MITLKDVALEAGVSTTTVSLVINGTAKAKGISDATIQNVNEVISKINYKPSRIARSMKNHEASIPTIAFFWPLDHMSSVLGIFTNIMAKTFQDLNFECTFTIQNYQYGKLSESLANIDNWSYDGILFGAASYTDMIAIDKLNVSAPIVLINRYSNRHSTVYVSGEKFSLMAVNLFKRKGCTDLAIISSKHMSSQIRKRTETLIFTCRSLGINIDDEYIFDGELSYSGGMIAAEKYCKAKNPPRFIFCDADNMALGALNVLQNHGYRIPDDIELLATGRQGEMFSEATYPSLSTISLNTEEMVTHSIRILVDQIVNKTKEPVHIETMPEIKLRQTFVLKKDG